MKALQFVGFLILSFGLSGVMSQVTCVCSGCTDCTTFESTCTSNGGTNTGSCTSSSASCFLDCNYQYSSVPAECSAFCSAMSDSGCTYSTSSGECPYSYCQPSSYPTCSPCTGSSCTVLQDDTLEYCCGNNAQCCSSQPNFAYCGNDNGAGCPSDSAPLRYAAHWFVWIFVGLNIVVSALTQVL